MNKIILNQIQLTLKEKQRANQQRFMPRMLINAHILAIRLLKGINERNLSVALLDLWTCRILILCTEG